MSKSPLATKVAAAIKHGKSIKNASRNRNAEDEQAAIVNARQILASIYGKETHFFDRNGTDLDKNNCIDMDWNGYRVAVRNQPNNFQNYRKDIRLRLETATGNPAEWYKLPKVNPGPDLYVFTYTDGSCGKLLGWHLINVRKLIRVITDPDVLYKEIRSNNTGTMDQTTSFRILDVSIYPQIVCRSSMPDITAIAPLPLL